MESTQYANLSTENLTFIRTISVTFLFHKAIVQNFHIGILSSKIYLVNLPAHI